MSLRQQSVTLLGNAWDQMRVGVLYGAVLLWEPQPEPVSSLAGCSQPYPAALSCLGKSQVSVSEEESCVKVMLFFFVLIHRGWRWKEKRAASCNHPSSFCTCSVAKLSMSVSHTHCLNTLLVAACLGMWGAESQPCTSCGAAAAQRHFVC